MSRFVFPLPLFLLFLYLTVTVKSTRTYLLHFSLFLATFFTTTLAGVQWLNQKPLELANFPLGLPYSISLLLMLSAHEFGHYFAARYHGIQTTLPYYIPVPPFVINPFGTMGAVIRIRSGWQSRKSLFDIGIAGPLAGFIVTMAILLYGFATLPGIDYLYTIHPAYRITGKIPVGDLTFGTSLLFWSLSKLFSSGGFIPPMNEVYHYPYLCVGWFGLFVTALNLIPVGQLDGGHIMYALVGGKKHRLVARIFFVLLLVMGVGSLLPLMGINFQLGSPGWFLWAAILLFIIKLDHPEVQDPLPISTGRRILGWLMIGIFILTFIPSPLSID
jgi:membrane-associated protease RseP (regulator of RpoE activity)